MDHIDSYKPLFLANPEKDIGDQILTPLAQRSHSRWLSAKKSINLLENYIQETNTIYSLVIHLRLVNHYCEKFHKNFSTNSIF